MYEYKVVTAQTGADLQEGLNRAAEESWELISTLSHNGYAAVMRREKGQENDEVVMIGGGTPPG